MRQVLYHPHIRDEAAADGGYSHKATYPGLEQGFKTKPRASRAQALNHYVTLSLCLGKRLSITLQLRSYLIFTVTVHRENMINMP